MRRGIALVLPCVVFALCALQAMGQAAGAPMTPPAAHKSQPPGTAPARVPLQPYTARYNVTETRTPASGATIDIQSAELIARDSQDRRVVATTPAAVPGRPNPVTRVSMSDPVARTNSIWTIPGRQVTVTAMPQPGTRTSCAPAQPPAQSPPSPKPVEEDLGNQTIMGVAVHGQRITTMIPASANGKQPAMTRITEEWLPADPGLRGSFAREITTEPPALTLTRDLQSLQEGEPNPAFFQVPTGYAVVNKPAPGSNCPVNQAPPPQYAPIAAPPPA